MQDTNNQSFKKGDKVRVRLKAELIAEFGTDTEGNPKTVVSWNTAGKMEHLFGAQGVIADITDNGNQVKVDFTSPSPHANYNWTLSSDMLEADNGIVKPVKDAPKVRKFLPSIKTTPTKIQIWNGLLRLQVKEKLSIATLYTLVTEMLTSDYDTFKAYIETAPSLQTTKKVSMKVPDTIKYYPKTNVTVLLFVGYCIKQSNYSDDIIDLLTSIGSYSDLLKELTTINNQLPLRRAQFPIDPATVWDKLDIVEGTLDKTTVIELRDHISDTVKAYLNKHSLKELTTQTVKVVI